MGVLRCLHCAADGAPTSADRIFAAEDGDHALHIPVLVLPGGGRIPEGLCHHPTTVFASIESKIYIPHLEVLAAFGGPCLLHGAEELIKDLLTRRHLAEPRPVISPPPPPHTCNRRALIHDPQH